MLSRPSWGRRKGGEGSTEDGRPGQAKNAIAPVVGAGRPLCLDGTGSGDTQDEPRDHWYLLADRLVARARREVLGPTGRCFSTTPPLPGFGGPGCISRARAPRAAEYPGHVSSEMPRTPLLGPCVSLARLHPWHFFSAPPRAPPYPAAPKFHLQFPFPLPPSHPQQFGG